MKKKALLAIHCLVYNHEPYLRECLDGFVMQKTNFPFVAIVHDDASTDNSADIIREYAEKYPDIIQPIYETENQYSKGNITRIMNTAIAATGCKYIALCEGDDYWTDPLKLQKQVDILEADETIVGVFTNTTLVNKDSQLLQASRLAYGHSFSINMDKFCEGGYDNIPTLSVVYRQTDNPIRKQRLDTMRNPFMGDWILWIALLLEGKFYYLDEITGAYRVNPTSVTHTVNKIARAKGAFPIIRNVRKIVPQKYHRHFSTRGWAWWDLGNAYIKNKQYFAGAGCMCLSFITQPCWFIKEITKVLTKKGK